MNEPKPNSAVILAGGLGKRLRTVLSDRPKVLAPVAGRRFVSYLLDHLADAGFRDVVLCTGYLGAQVREVFGSRFRRLELRYSEESEHRGTGGALRDALPLLRGDSMLVLNGDSYCQTDLAAFLRWHQDERSQASLVLAQVPDVSRFGSVEFDGDHRIRRFVEKSKSGSSPGEQIHWVYSECRLRSQKEILARFLRLSRLGGSNARISSTAKVAEALSRVLP